MFSRNQQIALALIPKATAASSAIALAYAIFQIASSPHRWKIVCNRLYLGVFIHELVRCSTYLTGTWMIPARTEGIFMAAGSNATCAAQSFVSQLGFAVPLYVTSIAFYLSTAVVNDFKISQIRWVEKWCHILPNSIPLLLSILLLAFNQYGADDTRCWIRHSKPQCMDRDFFNSDNTCSQDGEITYNTYMLSYFFFERFITVISLILSILFISRGCIAEVRKRKQNENFQGKRRYLEIARHTKSIFLLKQLGCLVLALFVSFGYLLFTRVLKGCFALVLSGAMMDPLFGLLSVLAFFKLKQPTCEQFESERSKFSLRNSVANQQIKFVTNGFCPKKEVKLKDDGGIYVGDDSDDCDDDYDDFELNDMNLTSTSVATRSLRSIDDSNNPKSFTLPSRHRYLDSGEYDICDVKEEPL